MNYLTTQDGVPVKSTNPLPTAVVSSTLTATTAADTVAAVGSSTTLVLAANTNRKKATIVNDSDSTVYIKLGAVGVLNQGIRMNANGGSYEIVPVDGYIFQGAINGIHAVAAATKNLLVTEEV